jgi:indole-3-glycerol phosphate synthase
LLEKLFAGALEDSLLREALVSTSQLEQKISVMPAALDPWAFLYSDDTIKVIAEVKRASPSRGQLAEIPNPSALALSYETGGAGAISVLTEQHGFKGSMKDLDSVRKAVQIPVLRKDFISTEYQVLESRAHGADMVLLIVAGLEPKRIVQLKRLIEDVGMAALVETHNAQEILFASEANAKYIGINARDLQTFETDPDLFSNLVHLAPASSLRIAESAIRSVSDVEAYANSGADAVLVGEALVTGEPVSLLREFSSVRKP